MNLRGMSAVITTVIFVSLALIAIGIVWVVISNLISNNSSSVSSNEACLKLDISSTSAKCVEKVCSVTLKRKAGGGVIDGVKIAFKDTNGASGDIITEKFNFEPLTTKTLTNLSSGTTGLASKVEISAYILDKSGKEFICPSTKSFSVSSSNCVPNCAGKECGDNGCGGVCAPGCLVTQTCTNGNCVCVPQTCVQLGKTCGSVDDGCGGSLNCGTCGIEQVCISGNCMQVLRIFVTSSPMSNGGNFGVAGADATCKSEAVSKGYSRNFKALIGTSTRQASTFPILADWVLKPDTNYYRPDGYLIDKTNSNAWFTFTPNLDNSISTGNTYQWTGLNPTNGAVASSNNCNSWTSNSGVVYGYSGYANIPTMSVIADQNNICAFTNNRLYCVEQP